jgi:hypothetical protein
MLKQNPNPNPNPNPKAFWLTQKQAYFIDI